MPNYGFRKQSKRIFDSDRHFVFRRCEISELEKTRFDCIQFFSHLLVSFFGNGGLIDVGQVRAMLVKSILALLGISKKTLDAFQKHVRRYQIE